MSAPGWIKLHRKIMDNGLWNEKPFSRGQAWVDLIMLANYEPKDVWFDGVCIQIPRGSFVTSIRKLAERWGWSRTKAKRYLNALESAQMVNVICDSKKTTITILNYEEYQGLDEDSEESKKATKRASKKPQKSHRRATDEPQKDTTKEIKKEKNQRNKETATPVPSSEVPAAVEPDDGLPDLDDIPEVAIWKMTPEEFEEWKKSNGSII